MYTSADGTNCTTSFHEHISNGQFVGGLNDVKTGLSIFCIRPANVPNWQQLNE